MTLDNATRVIPYAALVYSESRRRAVVCGQAPIGPARSSKSPPATGGTPVTSGSGRSVGDSVWPMRRSSAAKVR